MNSLTIVDNAPQQPEPRLGNSDQVTDVMRKRRIRCVLVDNFFQDPQLGTLPVVPHLGLMSLAAMLEEAGHAPKIFDPKILFGSAKYGSWRDARFLQDSLEYLLKQRPEVIGFTAYGRSLAYVIRIAERLKKIAPRIPVVLGGPHATILADKLIRSFACFDVIARFEAEAIIVQLIETLADGSLPDRVSNVVFRRDGDVIATAPLSSLPDLDDLPKPALHLYPISELKLNELSIEAGRGCPFKCTFCSTASFFRRKYRSKSNQRLIDEMVWARQGYGINLFNLNHDLFGLSKPNVLEFCKKVEGLDLQWKCSVRPDTIDAEMVREFRKAGCRHLYLGFETGSARLQKEVQKQLNLERGLEAVRQLLEHKLRFTASFITGFPQETREDQNQTLDFIGRLLNEAGSAASIQLHVLSPEPGSALGESDSLQMSFDGIGPEPGEVLDEPLIRAHPDIFSVYFHYHTLLPRARVLLASAFVMQLVPELAPALTTHLCWRFCDSSLSRLFERVSGPVEGKEVGGDELLPQLRSGLDQLLTSFGHNSGYVRDLVELGRRVRNHGRSEPGLYHFSSPVDQLVQFVSRHPTRLPPATLIQPTDIWYLIGVNSQGNPWLRRVNEPGTPIADASKPNSPNRLASHCSTIASLVPPPRNLPGMPWSGAAM